MCLQEARSSAGKKFAPGYIIHAAGHCNHSLGCETWISIDRYFDLIESFSGKVSEYIVEPGYVCNIYGDYRRLFVSFELFGAPVFVVNVHALHQSHGISNCIAFWFDTHDKILQYVPKLSNIILLGDLNTKLGGEISDCIGSFSADVPNKVGKALHRNYKIVAKSCRQKKQMGSAHSMWHSKCYNRHRDCQPHWPCMEKLAW